MSVGPTVMPASFIPHMEAVCFLSLSLPALLGLFINLSKNQLLTLLILPYFAILCKLDFHSSDFLPSAPFGFNCSFSISLQRSDHKYRTFFLYLHVNWPLSTASAATHTFHIFAVSTVKIFCDFLCHFFCDTWLI